MRSTGVAFVGVNAVETAEFDLPKPGPGEVLLEAEYTAVSPGTELRCLRGQQRGAPPFPFVAGYAFAGRVLEEGPGADVEVGRAVFTQGTEHTGELGKSWGGHVSHAVAAASRLTPIPGGLDLLDASLIKISAIAFHGVRLTRPVPGEQVAVVGLGPIGQLSARLHAAAGARVVAADLLDNRVELARQAGIEAFQPGADLAESFQEHLPGGADIVSDATGAPGLFVESMKLAKDIPWDDSLTPGARVLAQGSYVNEFTASYTTGFTKELTILFPRSCQQRDERTVADLMRRGVLRVRDLITDVRSPDDAARTYEQLRDPASGLMTVAFRWK